MAKLTEEEKKEIRNQTLVKMACFLIAFPVIAFILLTLFFLIF